MRKLPTTLESKMKIRFQDCDPYGHLNNSKYIDYIMTARGDQLIEFYDFDIYKMAQQAKLGWVAAQTQISYLHPAHIMEEVIIQTQLIQSGEKSLVVEAIMWNHNKSVAKALMWGKLVHYNLQTKKSQNHAEELKQFFKQIINPLKEDLSFEQRAMFLKNSVSKEDNKTMAN
ncbi:MAG: acyl-CoA thioesterase [Chitinophagaceae bacterium]|nr:acyl-CoA thioesterase [Chitinophagaceae bacterium]